MDDKEWRNFLQKQQDFQDEQRLVWNHILTWAQSEAAKKNMTIDQYIAWIEADPKAQGYAELLKRSKENAK